MPLKALFLVSTISNTEINIYFKVYVYRINTDCFHYWQGTIQASYAVMRQLLFVLNWTQCGRISCFLGIVVAIAKQNFSV